MNPAPLPMINPVRPYAWGSRTAIAALQGREPSGAPEAELWMGAHPAAPSLLETPSGQASLVDLIAADPETMLGSAVTDAFGPRLPFLLKILAADRPLSLQVHPSPEQARAGYDREERAGVPLDAAERNYRDPYAKPELICALEPFEALCGFREPVEAAALLDGLGVPELAPVVKLLAGGGLRAAVGEALTLPEEERGPLVTRVVEACARVPELAWAAELARHHPGDPGVVIALCMNRVRLAPGEAMYVPAGQPHSYLRGVGVEIMGASDNVLRGGLTGKHIDIPELLRILSAEPGEPALVSPSRPDPSSGEEVYLTPACEFRLSRVRLDGRAVLSASGPRVVLGTAGEVRVRGTDGAALEVPPGRSVFVPAAAGTITLDGAGTVFVAAVGGEARGGFRA
ncbi:mannose-6-phosphate isomerase, type 1 [Thermostaphylospora chromogena]|uniref:mannose-6-phosphate isomerase n=2 Tax=Thermostaphylospora chromogena TaxID=35622 RepID=A0A1H1HS86_9ACTN|nr:mannose-6-phosphate isomerase, type 1 [Thermostaphylospora chromogena]